MIFSKEVENTINEYLNLPATGKEQDWAIEMSDPQRVGEFWDFYKSRRKDLPDPETCALMELILCSYDEYLYESEISSLWLEIENELVHRKQLFIDILEYWALLGEQDYRNWFNLTPLIRKLIVNR